MRTGHCREVMAITLDVLGPKRALPHQFRKVLLLMGTFHLKSSSSSLVFSMRYFNPKGREVRGRSRVMVRCAKLSTSGTGDS